jgi:hypothetical protein
MNNLSFTIVSTIHKPIRGITTAEREKNEIQRIETYRFDRRAALKR